MHVIINVWLEFVFITLISKLFLGWEVGHGKPMGDVLEVFTEQIYKGARPS
jgi:hypothetical protein